MAGIHSIHAGSTGIYPFGITIAADTSDFNLWNALLALGWDGVAPVMGSVTINSGIVVSATSTAWAGLRTGGSFANSSDISIINNGYIVGMGGRGGKGGRADPVYGHEHGQPGGDALSFDGNTTTSAKIKLINNGVIAGGGGGGGGALSLAQPDNDGPGGGGGRSGRTNSAGGSGWAYPGTFSAPGTWIAPSGHGNSGSGGGWGGYGSGGSAWPGDWQATNGGAPGRAIVGLAGFTVQAAGTQYGASV